MSKGVGRGYRPHAVTGDDRDEDAIVEVRVGRRTAERVCDVCDNRGVVEELIIAVQGDEGRRKGRHRQARRGER